MNQTTPISFLLVIALVVAFYCFRALFRIFTGNPGKARGLELTTDARPDAVAELWYFARNKTHMGPYEIQHLRDLLRRGMVGPDTLVWNKTFNEWKPLANTVILKASPTERPLPAQRNPLRRVGYLFAASLFFLTFGGISLRPLLDWLGYDTATILSDEVPACDSITALDLAKQAIQNGPLSHVVKITAFKVENAYEIDYDSKVTRRTCSAVAFLNSGKENIQYTIEWSDKSKHEVWLELKDSSLGK